MARDRKRLKTDGEIAAAINKIAHYMRAIKALAADTPPQKETEQRERISDLISAIEASEHPAGKQMAPGLRLDYQHLRHKYIGEGARRFFDFPKNWIVEDGELLYENEDTKRKLAKKARAKARIQQSLRRLPHRLEHAP